MIEWEIKKKKTRLMGISHYQDFLKSTKFKPVSSILLIKEVVTALSHRQLQYRVIKGRGSRWLNVPHQLQMKEK